MVLVQKAKQEPGSSVTGSNAKCRSLVHGSRSCSWFISFNVTTELSIHRSRRHHHRANLSPHNCTTPRTLHHDDHSLWKHFREMQLHASTFAFTSQVPYVNAYCYCRLSTNIFHLKPCIDHNCFNTFSFCSKNCTRENRKALKPVTLWYRHSPRHQWEVLNEPRTWNFGRACSFRELGRTMHVTSLRCFSFLLYREIGILAESTRKGTTATHNNDHTVSSKTAAAEFKKPTNQKPQSEGTVL